MNFVNSFLWLTLVGFVINSDPDQGSDSVTNTRGILGPLEASHTGTDGANSQARVNSDQIRRVYSKYGEYGKLSMGHPQHNLYRVSKLYSSHTLFQLTNIQGGQDPMMRT